jgi:hypothetical protein
MLMEMQMKKQQTAQTTDTQPIQETTTQTSKTSNSDQIAWLQQVQQGASNVHQNMKQGIQTVAPIVGDSAQRLMGQGKGDIEREGTISDPTTTKPVSLETAFAEAKQKQQNFGEWLMSRYAFQPSSAKASGQSNNPQQNDKTLRIFSPGLNTPEPEASQRTAYYADKLNQPMVHIHNGTNKNSGNPVAEQIDYATAMLTRYGLKDTKLLQSLFSILQKALSGAEPQDVHAIFYSDSTIAGSRAIAKLRSSMITSRVKKGMDKDKAITEVDGILHKHLFVEMHGNVAKDLPKGPKYVLWADKKDEITHSKTGSVSGEMGFSGAQKDSDADALYVDYDGPFGKADAHNLQAVGVHAVRQTWWANGVRNSQELFDVYKKQGSIKLPKNIVGDPGKLWNPHNDPNWKP